MLCFSFRSPSHQSRSYSDGKQFIRYFTYVWGLSIFCTIFAYLFDTIEAIPNYLKPGFGTEGCFLKGLYPFIPLWINCVCMHQKCKISSTCRLTHVKILILLFSKLHHIHNECCLFDFNCNGNPSNPTSRQSVVFTIQKSSQFGYHKLQLHSVLAIVHCDWRNVERRCGCIHFTGWHLLLFDRFGFFVNFKLFSFTPPFSCFFKFKILFLLFILRRHLQQFTGSLHIRSVHHETKSSTTD